MAVRPIRRSEVRGDGTAHPVACRHVGRGARRGRLPVPRRPCARSTTAWARPWPRRRRDRGARRRDRGVPALPQWNADALKAALEAVGERHGLKLGKAQAPVRVAVTGRTVGPPLFESLEVLGRDEDLRRLTVVARRVSERRSAGGGHPGPGHADRGSARRRCRRRSNARRWNTGRPHTPARPTAARGSGSARPCWPSGTTPSTVYQVHSTGRSDQARPVDAIVVMGAAQYDGRPSPQLAARLDHAADLWRLGLAPVMVVTGGNQPGDRFTEAEASAKYLDRSRRAGRRDPRERRWATAPTSRSMASPPCSQRRGLFRVLVVSDPFHSLRSRLIAQELGLVAYVSPTRTSPVRGRADAVEGAAGGGRNRRRPDHRFQAAAVDHRLNVRV